MFLVTGCGKKKIVKPESGNSIGDTFYNYLLNDFVKQGGVLNAASKIGFINVDNYKEPIMYTITSKMVEGAKKYYLTLFMIEDGEVYSHTFESNYEQSIEIMYHVPEGKYKYFIKEDAPTIDKYLLIDPELKYNMKPVPGDDAAKNANAYRAEKKEYRVREDNSVYEFTIDFEEIELGMKNDLIIETNVKEETFEMGKKGNLFKDLFFKNLKKYKKIDEYITSDVKQNVEESLKKKEETKKDTVNGLKVGDYTIKYGLYSACVEDYCVDFELKEDGTVIYDGKTYYVSVKDVDFAQSEGYGNQYVHPAIILGDNPGEDSAYHFTPYGAVNGCILTDGDLTCIKAK